MFNYRKNDDEDSIFLSPDDEEPPAKNDIVIDLGRSDGERLIIRNDRKYTPKQIDEMADELLRSYARSIDPDTGKRRGISGNSPFLLEEHLRYRRRREIYNQYGVADPYLSKLAAERYHNNRMPKKNDDY